jgi:YD repeat-containing protein
LDRNRTLGPHQILSSWRKLTAAGANVISSSYDAAGNLTNRVYSGNRAQSLVWDLEGNLASVAEKIGSTNLYTWTAIYDAFGRRLRSTCTWTSGTNTVTETIDSWYDPLVEFQEAAVLVNGERTWKVHGPDVSGCYVEPLNYARSRKLGLEQWSSDR